MKKKRVALELKFASSPTHCKFRKIRTSHIKPAVRYSLLLLAILYEYVIKALKERFTLKFAYI